MANLQGMARFRSGVYAVDVRIGGVHSVAEAVAVLPSRAVKEV